MKKLSAIYIITAIILFCLLFIVTSLRYEAPFWDELYYLENIQILKDLGFTKNFLLQYKGPAGPTYALVHYILSPLTNLESPYVRLVNVVFLFFSMFLLYLTMKKINGEKANNLVFTLSTLAIPTIYTITGMALTEIFAIFFLSIYLYLLVSAYTENKHNWIYSIVAGLSLSLAILGRQPILVILAALPFFFIEYNNNKLKIEFKNTNFTIFLCVSFITSLIIPLAIFSLWGNIQPASEARTGVGLAPEHLVLALGYSALYVLFTNPRFFKIKKDISNKAELVSVLLGSILLNTFLLKVRFTPLKQVISNIIPSNYLNIYSIASGYLLTSMGLLFLYYFVKKQVLKGDKLITFLSFSFLLIVATSIKVTHQFSARYVAQAFPLILLAINTNRNKIKVIDIIMLIIGGVLGLISLENYFF